jgi:hypothetical protein
MTRDPNEDPDIRLRSIMRYNFRDWARGGVCTRISFAILSQQDYTHTESSFSDLLKWRRDS